MSKQVFAIEKESEYKRAGQTDLVALLPPDGCTPLFVAKSVLERLVFAIVAQEFTHLSGPTGSGKTSLLEAMSRVPANFEAVCRNIGYPVKPLKLFVIEMAVYDSPGELYQRRALKDGSTFDEDSRLVEAILQASRSRKAAYPAIWLREMGRVHTASVQGGLLDLMSRGQIVLHDGRRIDGLGIAWLADSNYQCESEATHTLVTLDDALRRRFSVNLTLGYLLAEQEAMVLEYLLARETPGNRGAKNGVDPELIAQVVRLGQLIRRHRAEGRMQSVPPPTIYGYMALLRMARALPHLGRDQLALSTILGNASLEDRKLVPGLLNEVFGLQQEIDEDDPTLGGALF